MIIEPLRTITTRGATGAPNGALVPIWHVDSGRPVEQVYLTTIEPGAVKGPHLHMRRSGAFTPILGNVVIVCRNPDGEYVEFDCRGKYQTVVVPPGTPTALYNVGADVAGVLNMPNPAWRDNSDEHAVTDWTYTR